MRLSSATARTTERERKKEAGLFEDVKVDISRREGENGLFLLKALLLQDAIEWTPQKKSRRSFSLPEGSVCTHS